MSEAYVLSDLPTTQSAASQVAGDQPEAEIVGRADVTSAATFRWLDRNTRSPFFLWVHFFDPHYPWTPPPEYLALYDQQPPERYDGDWPFVYDIGAGVFDPSARDVEYLQHAYAGQISYADHYIGEVLGSLAQRGLLRNTIIVFTTDTGQELGEHGTTPDGDYWLVGDDLYSPGIQVPLIVYDPRFVGSKRLRVPIQHIDVMPTLLELLSLPSPAQTQGRSIVPLLLGRSAGRDRAAFITLEDDRQSAIVTADGWKLIANRRDGTDERYDLGADPGEQTDLASANPNRVADLANLLHEWENEVGGG